MRNIICIGGSSGCLDALRKLLRPIPASFPASIFIVRHSGPGAPGLLPEILQSSTALPVVEAKHEQDFQPGQIYVAPVNHHLLLSRTTMLLSTGPKENWSRPAIDPLFRSAAQFHGPRAVGVVLSGGLDDGTAGMWALRRRGGLLIVQSPGDAVVPEMPQSVLEAVDPDLVAGAEEIGHSLSAFCRRPAAPLVADQEADETIAVENALALRDISALAKLDKIGGHPGIVCPECSGKLWQLHKGPRRYRCHVGHAMSARTLLAQQQEATEAAGWQFMRALEEEAYIMGQLRGTKDSAPGTPATSPIKAGPAGARALSDAQAVQKIVESLINRMRRGDGEYQEPSLDVAS